MLWVSANFLETFFYFAVPIFFMISGATLLDYRERYSTKVFLKKRFSKTLIPFIFWSLFAGLFAVKFNIFKFDWNVLHIIDSILHTKYIGIYWFFPALFAIYLSIPILSAVQDKIKVYSYAVLVAFICVSVLPLICSLLKIGNWPVTPPVTSGYVIYVLAGYLFSKVQLDKKKRYILYALGVIGWLMHFGGTIYFSLGKNEINRTFKGYLNLPAVLQAFAVFVFFQNINYEKIFKGGFANFEKVTNTFASFTFGIYLLHKFPLQFFPWFFKIDVSTIWWRFFAAFGIFFLCSFITWVVKKIPVVRNLLP